MYAFELGYNYERYRCTTGCARAQGDKRAFDLLVLSISIKLIWFHAMCDQAEVQDVAQEHLLKPIGR